MKIFEEWLNERFVPFSSLLTKEDGQKYIKELKKVFKETKGLKSTFKKVFGNDKAYQIVCKYNNFNTIYNIIFALMKNNTIRVEVMCNTYNELYSKDEFVEKFKQLFPKVFGDRFQQISSWTYVKELKCWRGEAKIKDIEL